MGSFHRPVHQRPDLGSGEHHPSGFNTTGPYVYENCQSDNKAGFCVRRLMACADLVHEVPLLQDPVFLLLGPNYRSSVVVPFCFGPVCYCLSETTGMGVSIARKPIGTR